MNYDIPAREASERVNAEDRPLMTKEQSIAWRPEIEGWAEDILPFYDWMSAKLPNPCTVVEVGVAYGRSAIFLAEKLVALGHGSNTRIYCVDDWGGGWSKCMRSLVTNASDKALEMLRPLRADSRAIAGLFTPDTNIDLVFIDADHSEIGCYADLEAWGYRVRNGGVLSGHDYADYHPGVVSAVDRYFAAHEWKAPEHPTHSVWMTRIT